MHRIASVHFTWDAPEHFLGVIIMFHPSERRFQDVLSTQQWSLQAFFLTLGGATDNPSLNIYMNLFPFSEQAEQANLEGFSRV